MKIAIGETVRTRQFAPALVLALLLIIPQALTGCVPNGSVADEAQRHNNLGVALMDAGILEPSYFPKAVSEFEAALRIAPAYAIARTNLGIASYYAGRKEKAIEIFEDLVAESPDDPRFNFMLGLIRESDGDYGAAGNHFTQVVRQDSNDPPGIISDTA